LSITSVSFNLLPDESAGNRAFFTFCKKFSSIPPASARLAIDELSTLLLLFRAKTGGGGILLQLPTKPLSEAVQFD
jgi:hypothetical protein